MGEEMTVLEMMTGLMVEHFDVDLVMRRRLMIVLMRARSVVLGQIGGRLYWMVHQRWSCFHILF
jgi:hypothetical protein